MTAYSHKQNSMMSMVFLLFIIPVSIPFLMQPRTGDSLLIFLAVGIALVLAAASMHTLSVQDAGEYLMVRFGPLPIWRKRLNYADMSEIRVGRSKFLDGWGIHWRPGRGWIYNISGYDCVEMRYRGEPLRIGTDDAENLAAFLKARARS